jgi:hypothetical protein
LTQRDISSWPLKPLELEKDILTLYQVDILIKHFRNLIRKFREPHIAHGSLSLELEAFIESIRQTFKRKAKANRTASLMPVYILASSNPCRYHPVKMVLKYG